MRLNSIVAVSENDVIGRQGALPWRLPADLSRFREITWGHALLMGRKTLESIGRALPGRESVVVSSRGSTDSFREVPLGRDATLRVHVDVDSALASLRDRAEVFAIGGAQLFAEVLGRSERLFLTRVHASIEGDVRLEPGWLERWLEGGPKAGQLESRETHAADEKNEFPFSFEIYSR